MTGDVLIDAALVRRLVAAQFPQWADLPVAPVAISGWDNATYRLGDEMSVRLPRYPRWVGQVEREQRWLPRLAPHLPLPIPVPLARGEAAEGYPFPWALDAPAWDRPPVWIHGDPAPGNVLAIDGRLSAVIDFGTVAVGDPACDLIAAWTFFSADARRRVDELIADHGESA